MVYIYPPSILPLNDIITEPTQNTIKTEENTVSGLELSEANNLVNKNNT